MEQLVRGELAETATRGVELCRCGLPTQPPLDITWWRPDQDVDPGPRVRVVVRYGDEPDLRRLERVTSSGGWSEHGAMVDFYQDRTPPIRWHEVGHCWADTPHPVVAVRPDGTGGWRVCA